jgi:hypothetical protein
MEMEAGCRRFCNKGPSAPLSRTKFRRSGPSPAMLPKHHAHCSRTSAEELSRSCAMHGTAAASTT